MAQTLISDSDGTLVNTVSLIRYGQYEAAKKYFWSLNIPSHDIPDYETYDSFLVQAVGGSARHTLESTVRLLYSASPHYLEAMNFDHLHDMLNPTQDALAPSHIRPFPGLPELLSSLGAANIKFAIFSSGTPHHIVRNLGIVLPELGMQELYKDQSKTDTDKLALLEQRLSQVFSIKDLTIVTADDTKRHKPEPDSLLLAIERLGASPDSSAVLGDHKVDMQAATKAGIATIIGMTHGFDDEPTLRLHGATHTTDSLRGVAKILGL